MLVPSRFAGYAAFIAAQPKCMEPSLLCGHFWGVERVCLLYKTVLAKQLPVIDWLL